MQVTDTKFLMLFVLSAFVGYSADFLDIHDFLVPTDLVAIFGAAVSICLAFRINTGYSRWRLARQVRGGLIIATQIIALQSGDMATFFGNKEDYRQTKLAEVLRGLYVRQGQAEAIKNTVLAWRYVYYTKTLVRMLAAIIILSQVNSFSVAGTALVAFIATVFLTIEQIDRNLDNPFENGFNDAPLSIICWVIEIDMLQQTGQP